jgi:anti-sigma regulatory factor (Ser/Thr protein kinase)
MVMEKGVFSITFTDEAEQGVPPPLQPALGKALLDRKGNLGIGRYLIHSLMDDVQYERAGIQNRLTIKKKIA